MAAITKPAPDGGAETARAMWHLLEPIHAVAYFAPECHDRYRELGLTGFWMGYFASRAAALGEASPELVTATFFNFHPAMVRRALPDAWALASPESVLAARTEGATAALNRISTPRTTPTDTQLEEAAELLQVAVAGCSLDGRALFAALRSVAVPTEPMARLWHLSTLLREHRGDGHVAACLAHGINGLEAHVTLAATGMVPRGVLQPNRGWSDEEWADAERRLHDRGWLDDHYALSPEGRTGRRSIEDLTDRLAADPSVALSVQQTARLRDLLATLTRAIGESGAIPAVNPMGLPTPRSGVDTDPRA